MMRSSFSARLLALVACAALPLVRPVAATDWMIVDPGQGTVPLAGGGAAELSGLTWIGADQFLAITDNVPQMFALTINVDSSDGRIDSAAIGATTALVGSDLEGIAFQPSTGEVLVSDESGPHIRAHALPGGALVTNVALPAVFANIRANLSLEALTWDDGAGFLWTANEEALSVDGPVSSLAAGTTVRLQRFDAALDPDGQWAYVTDPLPGDIGNPGRDVEVSGVPALLALADGTLLVLERAVGNSVLVRHRLYQVDFTAASDTSALAGLDGEVFTPVAKTLIWERNVLLTNFEGATVGPVLDDGAFSVILVSDNGGGLTQSLYALAVRPLVCGDGIIGGAETCDDGNNASGDGCTAECVAEICGDGIVNAAGAEQCDDGNDADGDGCDETCGFERAAINCQKSIAKAGRSYFSSHLKALQDCRNKLNKGKTLVLASDPEEPIADPNDCAGETRAVSASARAAAKARTTLARKCTDTQVDVFAACADSLDGLVAPNLAGGCLLTSHTAAAAALVGDQYGELVPSDQPSRRLCQEAIGKSAAKFAAARLRALQSCRDQLMRGTALFADKAKQQPVLSADACATAYRTASQLARAGARLRSSVARRCTNDLVSDLTGVCAASVDGLVGATGASGCLVDGAALGVDALLDAQY